jgi:uncharacterized protein YbbK (DUF523 family)
MIRPKILISACLDLEKVRYDGQDVPSQIVKDIKGFVDFIKVCPEFEIGLGVPREPIRIVKVKEEYRLIQHKTEEDVTDKMNNFSKSFVDNLNEIDGAIFKSKSPTMGLQNIKVYSGMEGGSVIERCGGFFASRIAEKFGGHPIEEDDRLRNKKIRNHFLTQVFLFAGYREAIEKDALLEFHEKNILLFNYYNKELAAKLNYESEEYFPLLKVIFEKPPKSEDIADFFFDIIVNKNNIIEKYKENKLSLEALRELSKILIKDEDLLEQTFFSPFPEELSLISDEDRDKVYWR